MIEEEDFIDEINEKAIKIDSALYSIVVDPNLIKENENIQSFSFHQKDH